MPLVKIACDKRAKFIVQISKNALTPISIFQAKIRWVSKWTTKYVTLRKIIVLIAVSPWALFFFTFICALGTTHKLLWTDHANQKRLM